MKQPTWHCRNSQNSNAFKAINPHYSWGLENQSDVLAGNKWIRSGGQTREEATSKSHLQIEGPSLQTLPASPTTAPTTAYLPHHNGAWLQVMEHEISWPGSGAVLRKGHGSSPKSCLLHKIHECMCMIPCDGLASHPRCTTASVSRDRLRLHLKPA